MESGFDLKAIPVVMLGGGASVVKGNVSEQDSLCRVFALIDDKVNSEGYVLILGQFSGGVVIVCNSVSIENGKKYRSNE